MKFSPPPGFPYKWCSAWGEDAFGVWLEFSIKNISQRMRWISPGKFLMGSPEYEHCHKGRYETQHEVTLSKGFWLADTACPQELWQTVMQTNPSKGNGAQRPIENVSWNDCNGFLHKATVMLRDITLSLPTEAQWEYACRAGTKSPFSFGEDITPEQVNYNGEYPYYGEKTALNRKQTAPVKSLPPNQWGLYEMHGNVWEWCNDWYGAYTADNAADPAGPAEGTYRALRGGSAFSSAADCRSAARSRFNPGHRYGRNGFRFLWNLPATETQKEQQAAEHHEWSEEKEDKNILVVHAKVKITMRKRVRFKSCNSKSRGQKIKHMRRVNMFLNCPAFYC